MSRRKIIPYNPKLKEFARRLRNNSTKAEIRLWMELKGGKMMGYDFHRQKPIDNFIVDFFCHELMLYIELDGISHQYEDVMDKDEKKEKRLKDLGLDMLRFEDDEIMTDMENVLRVIEDFIVAKEEEKLNNRTS